MCDNDARQIVVDPAPIPGKIFPLLEAKVKAQPGGERGSLLLTRKIVWVDAEWHARALQRLFTIGKKT